MKIDRNRILLISDKLLGFSLVVFIACFAFGRSFKEVTIVLMAVALLAKVFMGENVFPHRKLDKPLIVFFISLMLSFIFSVDHQRSTTVLIHVFKASIPFFASVNYVTNKERVKPLLYAFLFMTVLQGIDGIYQYLTGVDFIRGNILPESGRVTGSCGYWSVGSLMSLSLPLVFVLIENSKRNFNKIALLLLILFPIGTLILTKSRTAWFSFAIAFMIIFIFSKKRLIYIPIFLLPMILLIYSPSHILDRFESNGLLSDTGRVEIWATALNMFKDSPIVGQGVGTFKKQYLKYKVDLPNRNSPETTPHAHNIYLHALAELGGVGFLSLLYFIWVLLLISYRSVICSRGDPFLHILSVGLMASIIVYVVEGLLTHGLFRMWQMRIMFLIIGLVLAVNALVLNENQSEKHKYSKAKNS